MPNQIRQNQTKTAKPMILIAISLSLFWSLMPLIGWSRYSLEGALTSCSPEWRDHSFNVISFNISIIICVLGIPFIVLIISNIMLIRIVSLVLFIFYFHEPSYNDCVIYLNKQVKKAFAFTISDRVM